MANPQLSLVWMVSVSTPLEKQVDILKAKTNDFGRVRLDQVCDVGMSHYCDFLKQFLSCGV